VCTAQNVVAVERRLGGRLLVKPKQIVFQSATSGATSASSSLCLGIEDLTAEWRCKIAHNYQVDQHSTLHTPSSTHQSTRQHRANPAGGSVGPL